MGRGGGQGGGGRGGGEIQWKLCKSDILTAFKNRCWIGLSFSLPAEFQILGKLNLGKRFKVAKMGWNIQVIGIT